MARADLISGFFWLIFGCVFGIESYRLGLGSLRHPGPGFLFFWVSVFLVALSLAVLIQVRRKRKAETSPREGAKRISFKKIILVLLSVFVYALFMEKAGFILLTFLLFAFLLGVVERKGWVFTILTSAAVTLSAYLIFEVWLKTQLPMGVLKF